MLRLGRVVATPGALQTLEEAGVSPASLLARHVNGDWGDLDDHDRKENEISLRSGFRILSSYTVGNGEKIWVISCAAPLNRAHVNAAKKAYTPDL